MDEKEFFECLDVISGHLTNMETRFETIIDKYGISMTDATHFVFLMGMIRQEVDNYG